MGRGSTRRDHVRRRAARTATAVAIPVAIAVGAVSLWASGALDGPRAAAPGTTATSVPQATSRVAMAAPELAPEVAAVCREVIAALPDSVRDLDRRPVSAGAKQNAAYGEPPVTLACGTVQPTLQPTEQVNGLSGVCWYAQATSAGTVWTTVDRKVPVSVTVPGPQEGSAQSVIPFSAAVAAGDPPAAAIPTGCNS